MIETIQTYLQEKREQHIEELMQFLRIPSISAVAEHNQDIRICAEWTAASLKQAGLENIEIMATEGHPVVYADWLHAPGQPTLLIYGHYDVQPVEPLELWATPPFEPIIRDGKLYARGSTDDKGQLLLHVKAVEAFLQTRGSLPINVKFCIEGEEEIASKHLPAFVDKYKDKLQADIITLLDVQLRADLYVRPAMPSAAGEFPPLDPAVASLVAAVPGVAAVDDFRAVGTPLPRRPRHFRRRQSRYRPP